MGTRVLRWSAVALAFAAAGCAKKTTTAPSVQIPKNAIVISEDLTVKGDYAVAADKPVVLRGGAKLTVEGNLDVAGELGCDGGNLELTVRGTTAVNGKLQCRGADGKGGDVRIVVADDVTFAKNAEIAADGNVQISSRADLLADSAQELEKLYQEAGSPTGAGNRVGPFIGGSEAGIERSPLAAVVEPTPVPGPLPRRSLWGIPAAKATSHTVTISGRVSVGTPPPGVRRMVIFQFPDAVGLNVQNFELTGPDGRPGADDKGTSCNARGKDGEDAFRLLVKAPNITINNFKLKLGNGGKGGDAETKRDCKPGMAIGGKGGKPGNFKMVAGSEFKITGAFEVSTGNGGAGGSTTALGKHGGPSEDGGDARATGGQGGDNVKELSIAGTVAGASNVTFDAMFGGDGGLATADPGNGGDGLKCKQRGGNGGSGTATGGQGGKAALTLTGGAGRSSPEDVGGNGGDADAHGGKGGNGGNCDASGPGGPGGKGGDAKSIFGKGGVGKTRNGSDGAVQDETGGNGGNGGDGCGEGKGGKGGKGNPPGQDGADGKNLCVPPPTPTPTPTPTAGDPTPTPTATPTPTPRETTGGGGTQPTPTPTPDKEMIKVQVIQYNGKYLPVDQLIVESEQGCDGGQAHWHAAAGAVRATDGSMVIDPGPQCGYGKVKDKPTMQIEVAAE
ncbi:MAG: hypothetical protein G01um101431_858 [Parcubacteria group bacterium Gr01-1014_31]|nr:MAG: hypothetical protein G01um101431_858 [Parcubacteria group bacterium Gr01-1014_31]